MQVFVSWSGTRSRDVARLVCDWIPRVLQSVEPFMSAEDVAKGSWWSAEVLRALEQSMCGLLCVTKANRAAPWIHFEAGALAIGPDRTGRRLVVPLLLDLEPSDLVGPLAQLQATSLTTKADVGRLLRDLNHELPAPVSPRLLSAGVDAWWPRLQSAVGQLRRL